MTPRNFRNEAIAVSEGVKLSSAFQYSADIELEPVELNPILVRSTSNSINTRFKALNLIAMTKYKLKEIKSDKVKTTQQPAVSAINVCDK